MGFEEFCSARTAEATAADLPGYRTGLDRKPPDALSIGNDWSRAIFDGPFYVSPPPNSTRPACSLVFVQSRDGNTGASDPSTLGGGQTDRHVIYEGLSRVAADGVLAGAKTIGRGNFVFSIWRRELVQLRESLGRPRHPAQIIAARGGLDLDRGWLFNTPSLRVFVLTSAAGADAMGRQLDSRPWIEPIVLDPAGGLGAGFEALRNRGLERISAIGGRTLAASLIDAGLVQDIYLTTSPQPGGEAHTPMYPRELPRQVAVRKHGTGVEQGVVFEQLTRPF